MALPLAFDQGVKKGVWRELPVALGGLILKAIRLTVCSVWEGEQVLK